MNHLNDTQIKRMILEEATGDELRSRELHLETCARCRVAVEEARLLWEVLGAGDPAEPLGDRPLWPRVAAALDAARPGTVTVRPVRRGPWLDALRQPVTAAALLAAVTGIAGGHLLGNLVLDRNGGAGPAEVFASIPEASFLDGPAEGSLAAAYLGDYWGDPGFPVEEGTATDQADSSSDASSETPAAGSPDSSDESGRDDR